MSLIKEFEEHVESYKKTGFYTKKDRAYKNGFKDAIQLSREIVKDFVEHKNNSIHKIVDDIVDDAIEKTEIKINENELKCPKCSYLLKYKSEVAAPGYGQNWECLNCKNIFHKVGKRLTNWKDVEPDVFENKSYWI